MLASIVILLGASVLSLPVGAATVGKLPAFMQLQLPQSKIALNSTFAVSLMSGNFEYNVALHYTAISITYPNGTTVPSGAVGQESLVPNSEDACTIFPGNIYNFRYIASDLGIYKISINQTIGYPSGTNTSTRQFSCSPPLNYQSSFINSTFEVEGPAATGAATSAAAITTNATWAPTPTGSVVVVISGASLGASGWLGVRNAAMAGVFSLGASGLWLVI